MSYKNNNPRDNKIEHENVKTTQKIIIKGFDDVDPRQESKRSTPSNKSTNHNPVVNNFGPKNFFVFDIETVLCTKTAKTFLHLPNETPDEQVIEKLTAYHLETTNGQNEFFRQLFHKVVCISFIAGVIFPLKGGREKYIIKSIKTGGRNGESEEEILRAVFSYLAKHPSRLISFNGRGFDMPVLQYRAMKYGIDARWIYNDGYYNYNHRYSIEKHCDLLDMFSNFGASARVKMTEIASLFQIPVKNGVDGSQILPLYREGKIEEICNYCETDVIATYIMYLRFAQHSGRLSADGYNIVIENLLNMLKSPDAPAHQTLFAENFLQMNSGNVFLKTFENKQNANTEATEEEPEDEPETKEAE